MNCSTQWRRNRNNRDLDLGRIGQAERETANPVQGFTASALAIWTLSRLWYSLSRLFDQKEIPAPLKTFCPYRGRDRAAPKYVQPIEA